MRRCGPLGRGELSSRPPNYRSWKPRSFATGPPNLTLTLINSGKGVARGVNFFLHANGQGTDNVVGDGFLPAGEAVRVLTEIGVHAPPGVLQADLPDLAVMVAYRDARGFVHYRTHDGREHVPKTRLRRRPTYPDRTLVFKRLYPHIDPDAAKRVTHNIIKRPG